MENARPASNTKILFVATREPSYSRVSITRMQLEQNYQVDAIVSDSNSYPWRMLTIAWHLIAGWMTGRLRRCDAVFVGFLAQPIFPLVRLLYRGPIISDAYFSLYDAMVNDKRKVKAKSLVGRLCYWLDRHMLKNSQLCLTDTQQHVDYMRKFFDVPNTDIRRLWISAESQPIERPVRRNDVKSEPTTSRPYQVFFWGGFIPLQGVDTIVRSAAILKEQNVQFTIFGTGQTLDACLALRDELSADNISFAGWQQPDQIAIQAGESDLALGIFGTTEKAARVIPNKVYEAMAMGIPFVNRRSSATDELLIENEHCLLVDAGNAEQLAEKILWARDHRAEAKEMAEASRRLFADVCSPERVRVLMCAAIDDCLANSHSNSNSELRSVPSRVKSFHAATSGKER